MRDAKTYRNITGAGTTVIKASAGMLHALVVNKAVAAGVITLYDNTAASGGKIGTITHPLTLLSSNYTLLYDVMFSNGLTVVTSAADDLTVVFL